ncbi:glycosyltransferase family 4 protein [Sulfitobacter pontiacus]|uniref:glycosyltransferase family 4 protein n=1 Tax=Sulfitobacter pontiacus TaxID=60137 RepID=UPI0030EC94BA
MAKILYICGGRSFHSSHLNRKIEEVANSWRNAGHDVKHICGGDILSASPQEHTYGSQPRRPRWYADQQLLKFVEVSVSEHRDVVHDQKMLEFLETNVSNWKPDIVWERSSRLHSAGLHFAKALSIPYVLEWKDNLVNYNFSLRRHQALKLEVEKIERADHLVVESNILKKQLCRENSIDGGKVIVAHNAVDAAQFLPNLGSRKEFRKSLKIDDDTVLVGYLGSYAFYHDTSQLILAAELTKKTHPHLNIKFLMVGAGKDFEKCYTLASEKNLLGDYMLMISGVPKKDVPKVLSALDIAVLPGSTDIICPIKVQEYMASELPSVVPNYACNREVLADMRTGVLFEPGNVVDLAEKIECLARDRELRKSIGQAAQKDVIERFSWQATWVKAVESIISSHS